jgi:hypothetical protein
MLKGRGSGVQLNCSHTPVRDLVLKCSFLYKKIMVRDTMKC